MSLGINTDDVSAVLLADGWHRVQHHSFSIDSYEFMEENNGREEVVLKGGQSGICPAGFIFHTTDGYCAGPLTSILAIKYQIP
jgi:hypothetical protein